MLSSCQDNFKSITRLRERIAEILDDFLTKKESLARIHEELLTLNHTKLFVFGLDSLQFQQQMIQLEHENMTRSFQVIDNRLYGDLYKLHSIISNFINNNSNISAAIPISTVGNRFPNYNDIDIYQKFPYRYTKRIVVEIADYLTKLRTYHGKLTSQLSDYEKRQQTGLNINNFIFAFQNCQQDLDNKINLFTKYFLYFTALHESYLDKFVEKLTTAYSQVDEDIQDGQERLTNLCSDSSQLPDIVTTTYISVPPPRTTPSTDTPNLDNVTFQVTRDNNR